MTPRKKTPKRETPTDEAKGWSKPQPVTDVDMAFPARGLELAPAHEDIPKEYDRREECTRIVRSWFSKGLPANIEFYMVDGVDGETAFRHLSVILGCYGFQHQHKEAAAAYLLSLWTTDVKNWEQPNG